MERRVAELEGQAKPAGPPRMPGLKSSSGRQRQRSSGKQRQRQRPAKYIIVRHHGSPRSVYAHSGSRCSMITDRLGKAATSSANSVACRRRCIPPAQLDGVALGPNAGRQPDRRIATREEGHADEHPVVSVHRPSAAPQRGGHCERHSPDRATGPTSGGRDPGPHPRHPVHADETGWRQNGANGYVWTFSTPTERYFLRTLLPAAGSGQGGGGRSAGRVILRSTVSDCYGLPALRWPQATVLGPKLRDIHDQRWPSGPRQSISSMSRPGRARVYVEARSFTHPQAQRATAQLAWERQLWSSASPSWLTR